MLPTPWSTAAILLCSCCVAAACSTPASPSTRCNCSAPAHAACRAPLKMHDMLMQSLWQAAEGLDVICMVGHRCAGETFAQQLMMLLGYAQG